MQQHTLDEGAQPIAQSVRKGSKQHLVVLKFTIRLLARSPPIRTSSRG